MEKRQCCIKVSDSKGWHSYPCSKPATVEVDGKWYCGTHNPVKVAERNAKATEKWGRESNLRIAERIAGDACLSINPDNPQAVAESIKDMYEAFKVGLDLASSKLYQHPSDAIAQVQFDKIKQELSKAERRE